MHRSDRRVAYFVRYQARVTRITQIRATDLHRIMQPQFTKFHGLGNDYLVFESEQLNGIDDPGEFARRICNRHYGAGADGIAIIGKAESEDADFSCRIFNPDGSEAVFGPKTSCG